MELLNLPLHRRVLRRLIRASLGSGPGRGPGRWLARRVGWPLPGGARILLADPDEYIQRLIISHGVYEPNLAYVIGNLSGPGRNFFDVGANIGQHSLISAGRGAHVVAYEPLPRLAGQLRASIALNRIVGQLEVVPCAIGREPGEAILHVSRRSDDGSHSLLPGVEAAGVERLTVPVSTLDRETERMRVTPDLVKVDVEGYEARVLDGAKALMHSAKPPVWIIETADRLADQLNESAATVVGRLIAAGYEIWELPEYDPPTPVTGAISGKLTNHIAVHPHSALHAEASALLRRMRRT